MGLDVRQMHANKKQTINFVAAANVPSSITRLITEYANCLVGKGFEVIISFPVINHWDHHQYWIRRSSDLSQSIVSRLRYLYRLLRPPLKRVIGYLLGIKYREWQGKILYKIDDRVQLDQFVLTPTNNNMPDADYIFVMQNYLIPRLLYLQKRKGVIVGSLHMDYLAGMNDQDSIVSDWWSLVCSIDQRLNVPLIAVSRQVKGVAQHLGIRVDGVIHNGIDLKHFTDGGRRGELTPLTVTLFCATHPQKGLEFGCQVVRELRKEFSPDQVVLCSVGDLKPEHLELFDVNPGYLGPTAYAKMYQNTDIVIYPSLYDAFPGPPLDAMASGCALATTLVAGVEEYAVHRENCMVAMPNDVRTMVSNVKMLIQDYKLRDKIRENGLSTAKKFSWDLVTDELINCLSQLPPGNKGKAGRAS